MLNKSLSKTNSPHLQPLISWGRLLGREYWQSSDQRLNTEESIYQRYDNATGQAANRPKWATTGQTMPQDAATVGKRLQQATTVITGQQMTDIVSVRQQVNFVHPWLILFLIEFNYLQWNKTILQLTGRYHNKMATDNQHKAVTIDTSLERGNKRY